MPGSDSRGFIHTFRNAYYYDYFQTYLTMMNDNNDQPKVDVEALINNHLASSYMALYSAELEAPLQTVAHRNLLRIAYEQRQRAINYSKMMVAYQCAVKKGIT